MLYMTIIDGKKIADEILTRLATLPKPKRFLAAVLIGDDPSSMSFLKQKEKTAWKLGVDFRLYQFSASIAKDDLRLTIKKMGNDPACGGIILQLPLPNRDDEQDVLNAISRVKDIDVLGEKALAAFRAGESAILPPAVGVVREVIMDYGLLIMESTVAVIGAGRLVGRPIATWLTGKAKEVLILDKGDDLKRLEDADVVISGAGVPGLITPDMLKDGAIVIDFGYGLLNGKPSGDFNGEGLRIKDYGLLITPTPGGTGPILVAKLFENFYALNDVSRGVVK